MPSYLVHFNKNHDKLGRFTFGDGDGDGINADSYRTPEIDALYNKYSSLFKNAYAVDSYIDDRTESDKKLLEKITDMSAKALKNIGEYTEDEIKEYTFHDFDYDFFEYFYGYRTVAYLASKGYDKDQIKDIIEANAKIRMANYQFEKEYEKINPEPMVVTSKQHAEWADKMKNASPYPNNSAALFSYPHTYINADKDSSGYKHLDSFIDECIKLSKEMEHSDSSDYLVHFNRLHDKKGRFTFGDGDGDGRSNDRRVAEGDRVRDVPNSGRSGFEGGGGGRFGSGRTSSGEYSKREAESRNTRPDHKPRYEGNTSRRNNKLFGDPKAAETNQARSLANNKQVGIARRSGRDYIVKAGRRNPPEKSGDQIRNGSSNPWDSVRGSNINVAGGSSKGYGASLSSEQVEDYRVAGQNWVVDKLDEITDPEWWKEQEKKARAQLGLYKKEEKTVPGKSHEVTPKAMKVAKSTPKKQEKQKTR